MQTPVTLLKFIAKALLNASGLGLAGEVIAEVLPDVAKDTWDWWNKDGDAARRQAELQALAQMHAEAMREQVIAVVEEVAANKSTELRKALSAFLEQIPAMVRQTLGKTIPSHLVPRSPEDVLAFLPRWTLVCNGGFRQESATIRARRRISLDGAGLSCFEAIAESLAGSFPYKGGLHHKVIRWWLKAGMLFVEVRIIADYFPSSYVTLEWATEDAMEVLGQFEAALTESA